MPRSVARVEPHPLLLPSALGHVTLAPERLLAAPDAIEAHLERVAGSYRGTRASGAEQGYLAYAPHDAHAPLLLEEDAVGTASEISWHWRHPKATVAYSFHTHPGAHGMCRPSGIDGIGALVRGDHTVYVLTMDGRLAGWRFRDREGIAWAVEDAMSALERGGALRRGFLRFLYEAFDAMLPDLMEPVYAARVQLVEDADAPGAVLTRADPRRGFFLPGELG